MNKIIFFILGVVVGGTLVWLVVKMTERKKKETLIQRQAREKETNKEAVLGLLETQGKLTNNHIEMMLGISDATAERYLNELEKEGKVRQVGGTGSGVFYEKI
ncbi:MAG: DUF977 family protein [Patescibacteria group bacterium]